MSRGRISRHVAHDPNNRARDAQVGLQLVVSECFGESYARLMNGNADSGSSDLQFTLSGLMTASRNCGSTISLTVRQAFKQAP